MFCKEERICHQCSRRLALPLPAGLNAVTRHADFKGSPNPAALLPCRTGRNFQYAAKYWFGCSLCLVLIVVLSQDVPALQPWNPLYVLFTQVVVLSEKVCRRHNAWIRV